MLPRQNETVHIEVEDDDDDDYWNAYGAGNDDSDTSDYSQDVLDAKKDDAKTEDAYWAQYSTVQGQSFYIHRVVI
jgi:hypothetical protein